MKSKDQAEKALANAKAMSEVITITLVLFVTPFVLCEEVGQIGKLLEVHLDHLVGTLVNRGSFLGVETLATFDLLSGVGFTANDKEFPLPWQSGQMSSIDSPRA